jgi:YfiH family protein
MTIESFGFSPDWPLPPGVRALQTVRAGGVSEGPWCSFNLGDHVGDEPAAVAANRDRLGGCIAGRPRWLRQVHGTTVCDLDAGSVESPEADAAVSRGTAHACVVMTADCLPVLLCDQEGDVVAAAHAGWRGLQAGVIEAAVVAMAVPATRVTAWLGPAIGPATFEVGDEVRSAFVTHDVAADACFRAASAGKWLADLYGLARLRLMRLGVPAAAVFGGGFCTHSEAGRFFSYRRDGVTGRMASLIWRE